MRLARAVKANGPVVPLAFRKKIKELVHGALRAARFLAKQLAGKLYKIADVLG